MREIAAIYSRISHDPEGRQAGVERQEQDCRLLAHERGWEVLEPPYRENDTSASTRSRTKRPVFERLLADAAAGRFSILLAYSTSRLTRRPLEYERLIALTTATSLQIHTVVSGSVRLDTADGRALARVLAAIDAAEAERLSERVKRAKLGRAEQGLWHGGPHPPYGYRYTRRDDGHGLDLEVYPARAALVLRFVQPLTGSSSYRTRGAVPRPASPGRNVRRYSTTACNCTGTHICAEQPRRSDCQTGPSHRHTLPRLRRTRSSGRRRRQREHLLPGVGRARDSTQPDAWQRFGHEGRSQRAVSYCCITFPHERPHALALFDAAYCASASTVDRCRKSGRPASQAPSGPHRAADRGLPHR